jgi:hypothetical protein
MERPSIRLGADDPAVHACGVLISDYLLYFRQCALLQGGASGGRWHQYRLPSVWIGKNTELLGTIRLARLADGF